MSELTGALKLDTTVPQRTREQLKIVRGLKPTRRKFMNKRMSIEELTEFLNEEFKKTGKTKTAFAKELGMSLNSLHLALKKSRSTYLGMKIKVADALGYKVSNVQKTVKINVQIEKKEGKS